MAIEIEIVDFPIKNGGSFQFAMLNYQRVSCKSPKKIFGELLKLVTGHNGLGPWVRGIFHVGIGAGIHEEHQPKGQIGQGINASGSTEANLRKKTRGQRASLKFHEVSWMILGKIPGFMEVSDINIDWFHIWMFRNCLWNICMYIYIYVCMYIYIYIMGFGFISG